MNGLISHDSSSPEDLDDLLITIGTQGIDVLERQPVLPSMARARGFEQEDAAAGDEVELDLTAGALVKTDGPIRIYLPQTGVEDLLPLTEKVDLAHRIKLGQ